MIRLYVDAPLASGATIEATEAQAHYLGGVMRRSVGDTVNLFNGAESYIKQIRLPYSVYVCRSSWSKLIIFAHNVVIYFGVLL